MKKVNIISSILIILVAVFFLYLTFGFKKVDSVEVGAAFMPRVYTSMLILLSVILLAQSRKLKAQIESTDLKMVLISIGLIAIYIVITPILGFYISTLLIVLALLWFSKVREPILLVATPSLIALFIYIFFQRLLDVPIPLGIFFS